MVTYGASVLLSFSENRASDVGREEGVLERLLLPGFIVLLRVHYRSYFHFYSILPSFSLF